MTRVRRDLPSGTVTFLFTDRRCAPGRTDRRLRPRRASAGLGLDGRAPVMRVRRGLEDPRPLCAGPGRLCQALAITREHDALPLDQPPFELLPREKEPEIAVGPRVGITKAVDQPWRYCLSGSRFLSPRLRGAVS